MRVAKLIMITEENNNKFYNMTDNGSGIAVEYGRVGATCQTASYSSYEWDKIYKSKVKKGYKDVTELFTVAPTGGKVDFLDIEDTFVNKLIKKLEAYTKKQVSTNYEVSADSVTKKQIDEAQQILDYLMKVKNNRELNKTLLELFAVIPRKMKKVADHLADTNGEFSTSWVSDTISKEQDLLDSMSQQVNQVVLVKENTNNAITLLDAMGIELFSSKADQDTIIKNKLGSISDKFVRGFRIENKKTQKQMDEFLKKSKNKKTELFWHGSRNENWLPIIQTGLVLRPTNAVISGKMFGYGTYFADKAIKSYGYTSGRGSYWANGSSPEAFMSLYEVHVGNQLHIKRHESWCSSLDEKKLKAKGEYDSLFAEGGADLRNNEFIVYNESQTTIKYIVELKG